jgi:hypothetical protein
MKTYILKIFLAVSLFTFSCTSKSKPSGPGTDLLKYGIPDRILVPVNSTIAPLGSGKTTGITITAENDLEVQGIMTFSLTKNYQKLLLDKKREISSDPYFVKIVEETDNGFLFEKQVTEKAKAYDFRVLKIIGDQELTYLCGIKKEYTEAEVKEMMKWVTSKI